MGYKSILTIVTNAANVPDQIDAAVALAQREDAHLDVLCLGLDRTEYGYYYIGGAPLAPVMLDESVNAARESAIATEAAVRKKLEAEEIRWAVDTGIAQVGTLGRDVGHLARFADLVVLPKPQSRTEQQEQQAILEAAIFEGRAPALLLPPSKFRADYGRRVVIAWNQSDEAMNAIRAALPILKAATFVNIAVIAPPAHGPERSDPGGRLSQFLSRHGVQCEVSVLARTLPHTSDVICRHVEDINADMVVMGAYGHSRFREAILGGTTRDMFESATVPIFVAH